MAKDATASDVPALFGLVPHHLWVGIQVNSGLGHVCIVAGGGGGEGPRALRVTHGVQREQGGRLGNNQDNLPHDGNPSVGDEHDERVVAIADLRPEKVAKRVVEVAVWNSAVIVVGSVGVCRCERVGLVSCCHAWHDGLHTERESESGRE